MGRVLTTALCVLLVAVIVAGCQAPTADPSGTGAATADWDPPIHTEGIEPTYEPRTVVERVETLRGLERRSIIRIHAMESSGDPEVVDHFVGIDSEGAKALNLYRNESSDELIRPGYARPVYDIVEITIADAASLDEAGMSQEAILAHEVVHALQFQHGLVETGGFLAMDTDEWLAQRAIVEGDAALIERAYVDRYVETSHYSIAEFNTTGHGGHWTTDLAVLPYYYGAKYLEDSDLDERTRILESPPTATSEIVAPESGVPEPTGPLPEPTDPGVDGAGSHVASDRVGALVLRTSLRSNGIPYERVAAATADWRNDRMDYYRTDSGTWAIQLTVRFEDSDAARFFAETWTEMITDGTTTDPGIHRTATPGSAETLVSDIRVHDEFVRLTVSPDSAMVAALDSPIGDGER